MNTTENNAVVATAPAQTETETAQFIADFKKAMKF